MEPTAIKTIYFSPTGTTKTILEGIVSLNNIPKLHLPGDFPYKEREYPPKGAPGTNLSLCTMCGEYIPVCPGGAISMGNSLETEPELWFKCCACVKSCPEEARFWEHPGVLKKAEWLSNNFGERKEPETFI